MAGNDKHWSATACKNGILGLLVVLAAFSLVLTVCVEVKGQVVGAMLSGTITDPSGGVVPNAEITVSETSTGVLRTGSSDRDGFYSVPNLQPGTYTVTVTATGFTRSGTTITLTVGQQRKLNLKLTLGSNTQSVHVTAAPPQIDLSNATISGVNEQAQIRQLPLNGRSWTNLVSLQPGAFAITEQPSASNGGYSRGLGQQFSISGNRPQEDNYRIDGVSVNDPTNGGPSSILGGNLGVEAISEFSVLTSGFPAAYGRAAGGIINATTKSGTNQFHGDAYEFARNSVLDAANYFDITKPSFSRNQFGASAGGPIEKSKVFIFGDYEGLRQNLGLTQVSFVPSQNARNGILSTGNVTVDPQVARFLSAFYPAPNTSTSLQGGDIGEYIFGNPQISTENFFTLRSDQVLSPKDSFHETYVYDFANQNQDDEFKNKNIENFTHRQYVIVDETHVFNPQFLNDARFGLVHDYVGDPGHSTAINPAVADTSYGTVPGESAGLISVSGLTSFSGGLSAFAPQQDHYTDLQGYDDASYTTGIHSISFGASVEWIRWHRQITVEPGGSWNFSSLSNFLTNIPTSLAADAPFVSGSRQYRQAIFGLYAQDDMHIRPNFTFNVGLRYQPYGVPAEANGIVASMLSPLDPVPGSGMKEGNPLYSNNSLLNFDPRLGFAWDPFNTGKTSIRGGFGIYDQIAMLNYFNNALDTTQPFFASISVASLSQGDFPTKAYQIGAATLNTGSWASSRVAYVQQHPGRAYVMEWNLSIERELTPNTSFMIGYVGNHGVHGMTFDDDINDVQPLVTGGMYLWPCEPFNPTTGCGGIGKGFNGLGGQLARMNPTVGRLPGTLWRNSSLYDALQAQITHRMSHSFQVQGSFAYQKCIDVASGATAGDEFLNGISSLPIFNSKLSRAVCDFDVPLMFTGNYLWNVPAPRSLTGFAGKALSGWELSGIVTAENGTPFTALLAGDPLGLNNTDPFDFPNRLRTPGCSTLVNPGNVTNYIKTQCFSAPSAVTVNGVHYIPFGNAGRNELWGPGLVDWDFSLIKDSRVSERFGVQFRFDAFNIFNHPNFASPVDNGQNFIIDPTIAGIGIVPSNPATDVISTGAIDQTTTTSRQLQFAVKVMW